MIAKGLDIRVPDLAAIALDDGPDLQAIRQRPIRDRVVEVAEHEKAVANDRVALGRVEGRRSRLGLVGPGRERTLRRAPIDARDLSRPRLRPVEERPAEPAAAPGGSNPPI